MAPREVRINGYLYDHGGAAVGVAPDVQRGDVRFPVAQVVVDGRVYSLASFSSADDVAVYLEVDDVKSYGSAAEKIRHRSRRFSRSTVPDTLRAMVEGAR